MDKIQFYNDLDKLIVVLPPKIALCLREKYLDDLIEIVLDIGRLPEIRHSDGKIEYAESKQDLITLSTK